MSGGKTRNPGANPGALVDGPRGGKLKRGGTNPGAGRPRLSFADECRDLQRDVILAKAAQVLRAPDLGPGDAAWEWAAQWVSRYGHSDAARRVAISVDEAEALPLDVLQELVGEGGE